MLVGAAEDVGEGDLRDLIVIEEGMALLMGVNLMVIPWIGIPRIVAGMIGSASPMAVTTTRTGRDRHITIRIIRTRKTRTTTRIRGTLLSSRMINVGRLISEDHLNRVMVGMADIRVRVKVIEDGVDLLPGEGGLVGVVMAVVEVVGMVDMVDMGHLNNRTIPVGMEEDTMHLAGVGDVVGGISYLCFFVFASS